MLGTWTHVRHACQAHGRMSGTWMDGEWVAAMRRRMDGCKAVGRAVDSVCMHGREWMTNACTWVAAMQGEWMDARRMAVLLTIGLHAGIPRLAK